MSQRWCQSQPNRVEKLTKLQRLHAAQSRAQAARSRAFFLGHDPAPPSVQSPSPLSVAAQYPGLSPASHGKVVRRSQSGVAFVYLPLACTKPRPRLSDANPTERGGPAWATFGFATSW